MEEPASDFVVDKTRLCVSCVITNLTIYIVNLTENEGVSRCVDQLMWHSGIVQANRNCRVDSFLPVTLTTYTVMSNKFYPIIGIVSTSQYNFDNTAMP